MPWEQNCWIIDDGCPIKSGCNLWEKKVSLQHPDFHEEMHNNGPYQYQSTRITRCSDTTKIDFILVGGNPTLMVFMLKWEEFFPVDL